MKAVIGLGNPGKEYELTRHNFGFICLRKLADKRGVTFRHEARFEGYRVKVEDIQLFMPTTYMNESGRAVKKLLSYFDIAPSKVLVVVDDMDTCFGQMRLKQFGGSGGHNGLKSLERELGTNHFMRLRLGIGRPADASIEHVLGRFSQEEQKMLGTVVDRAVDACEKLFTEEFAKVATLVNSEKDTKCKENI